jgi:adenosylhomocysteine nucleosidase
VVGLAAEARIAARFGFPVEAGGGTPDGAAQAASRLIGQGVTALVSFGLAGGLDPALRAGEVIVPSAVASAGRCDRDKSAHGTHYPEVFSAEPGRANAEPGLTSAEHGCDPDSRPGSGLCRWNADPGVASLFGGFTPHTIFAGSQIVADAASKRILYTETHSQAVDLESGAVANVAAANDLPFVVVRAICDPAGRNLPPAALIALDAQGGIGFTGIFRSILRHPGQIPDLLALARDAALARRALIQVAKRFQAEVKRSRR